MTVVLLETPLAIPLTNMTPMNEKIELMIRGNMTCLTKQTMAKTTTNMISKMIVETTITVEAEVAVSYLQCSHSICLFILSTYDEALLSQLCLSNKCLFENLSIQINVID